MKELLEQKAQKPRPLGMEGQWFHRMGERRVRKAVVAFHRWIGRYGIPQHLAAKHLGLRPSTLGRWGRSWHRDQMEVRLLGRRQRLIGPITRMEIVQHIDAVGPLAGLPSLRGMFPEVTRRELQQAQADYRQQWFQDNQIETEELEWLVPGAVWASDFTDPPLPIDGCYDNVLAARDLASRMHLEAMPVVKADSQTAAEIMEGLFLSCGDPLVIKTDNGSPFIGEPFVRLLSEYRVVLLLSPPRTPRYNGAVEAGNGSLKSHTFFEACRYGRGGNYTSDDLELARQQLNHTLRPWGAAGPTPVQSWQSRKPITQDQRQQFLQCLRQTRQQTLEEHGYYPDELLDPKDRATVARQSIRRALESLGYLSVQRKRISPPFNSPLRDKYR